MPRENACSAISSIPPSRSGTSSGIRFRCSILVHTAAVLALIVIIPLMAADVLPTPPIDDGVCGGSAAAAAAPTAAAAAAGCGAEAGGRSESDAGADRGARRKSSPSHRRHQLRRSAGVEGGVPGGVVGGVVGGIAGSAAASAAAAGGAGARRRQHQAADEDQGCPPVYPPIAQSARVQGVVIIEATIGPNGKVQDARVLRSIPLLDRRRSTP